MNAVTFTRIWPNVLQPTHGLFVEQRQLRLAARPDCDVRVVAPVPWYPSLPGPAKWKTFAGISRRETWKGIEVEHPRYPVIPKIGLRLQGAALARVTTSLLAKMARSSPIDVIDAHYLYPEGFAAVAAGRQLGIPTVLNAIGSDVYGLPKLPGIGALTRQAIRGADMLIAVSQPIADALVDMGASRDKIVLLPYGVDAGRFTRVPAGAAAVRARLGIASHERMVLNVGRLHPMKGQDVLLDAFARLAGTAECKDVRLVIVGAGDLRADLESRARANGIADRVTFAGSVLNTELGAWYSAADLFCLPSRGEGHPNVLIEALSCGTPAVASAVGAIPEVIRPSCGLVVPPEDVTALTQALSAGLAAVRDGLWSAEAAQAAVAGRSWEQVADEALVIYGEAIRRFGVQVPADARAAGALAATHSR